MSALICGSMAYDTIMVFPDKFKHHILPEQVHILNVAFLVPELRREYGGCAGNIAYNLKLLGEEPRIMATVGKDFAPYAQWLTVCGISKDTIKVLDDAFTAQAYITTDLDDNQITAFHPGAMSFSHQNLVPNDPHIRIGLISPDGKEGMIQHAAQFKEKGIPFIFDPGQGMPMFDGDELLSLVEMATWVTLNDYEAQLMEERTGLIPEEMAQKVDGLIITKGAQGSLIYTPHETFHIPPAKPQATLDPT
ncbi:MAG: carbohydrate kinase family protein, partial [Gammaproteobacteria bacterium]|nr:carbohydrate kinase family protein [Gammaproteobacteria bacterium]